MKPLSQSLHDLAPRVKVLEDSAAIIHTSTAPAVVVPVQAVEG